MLLHRNLTTTLIMLASVASTTGCWEIQEAQERGQCERALEKVCACSSIDCSAETPTPIVATLRRCDADEIVNDFHLSVCITESATYCEILSGLITGAPAVCELECNQPQACDQEQACHDYQYGTCGVPETGGM